MIIVLFKTFSPTYLVGLNTYCLSLSRKFHDNFLTTKLSGDF